MPKLEPKQIQKELESGRLWPVYWIYGSERMKSRELIKRIRREAFGDSSLATLSEDTFDGGEITGAEIVDAAQTLSLGGGLRVVLVRDAHLVRDTEPLTMLLETKPGDRSTLNSLCIFIAKDLDARKKFSKLLIEKAAVVPCDVVPEAERDLWISYLAKRRGLQLAASVVLNLRSLDPWTLDIVDQELEKFSLTEDPEVFLGSVDSQLSTERFLDAFYSRDLLRALPILATFADRPDESLPLLGLLAWNARYLALTLADSGKGARTLKLNPYLMERLSQWGKRWTESESIQLQSALAEVDFEIKQTSRLSLGTWTALVSRFCRAAVT